MRRMVVNAAKMLGNLVALPQGDWPVGLAVHESSTYEVTKVHFE